MLYLEFNAGTHNAIASACISSSFFLFLSQQILDVDREGLTKLKKAVKAMHASGNGKNFCMDM